MLLNLSESTLVVVTHHKAIRSKLLDVLAFELQGLFEEHIVHYLEAGDDHKPLVARHDGVLDLLLAVKCIARYAHNQSRFQPALSRFPFRHPPRAFDNALVADME